MVVIFIIIIFVRTVVEWLNILVCVHSSGWWQDGLEKSPVSGCDSSATINSDENLAERLVFKNHSRLVLLGRMAYSLVLDANTGAHRYLL